MSNLNLFNDDCFNVFPIIQSKSIDMILCDLPYGVTQNKWDNTLDLDKLWVEYSRVLKDIGVIVLFGKQPFTSILVTSNLKMFKYSLVWRKNLKTGNLNARKRPMGAYEDILVFYNKQPTYNPQRIPRTYQIPSGNKKNSKTTNYGKQREEYIDRQSEWLMPDDVIDYEDGYNLDALELENEMLYIKCVHNSQHKVHPTQKPVELLEWLIRTYTNEKDLVLDNCMGSGSTGVACQNLNRDFIGIEIDKKYFEIAEKRIKESERV